MFPVLLAEEDYNYFEGYVIIKRNKDKQQVYLVTIVSRQDLIGNRAFVVAALKLWNYLPYDIRITSDFTSSTKLDWKQYFLTKLINVSYL